MIPSDQQIRKLRQKAHSLKPVIWMGQNGLSPAVIEEMNRALDDHELIKIKLPNLEREERTPLIEAIGTATSANLIQKIGHIAVFFRKKKVDAK